MPSVNELINDAFEPIYAVALAAPPGIGDVVDGCRRLCHVLTEEMGDVAERALAIQHLLIAARYASGAEQPPRMPTDQPPPAWSALDDAEVHPAPDESEPAALPSAPEIPAPVTPEAPADPQPPVPAATEPEPRAE